MKATLFAIVSLIISYTGNAQVKQPHLLSNKDDNTLLWEITGKGIKPSYLFGTFHIMCKDDILISRQLKTAIAASDKLYLELDMDDPSVIAGGMTMMTMKDNSELKDFYTTAEYARIEQFFSDSLNMPMILFKRMKPFVLTALLYPKMMPCKTTSGVEEQLMKIAKNNKKEIKGLETIELQSGIFDSIPYAEQAKELLKSIDSIAIYAKFLDTMVNVYKSQQLKGIEKALNQSEFGMEENQDVLLYNRNRNWVVQLNAIMKNESVFIGVGAGHLVGKQGLIELLRKEGYMLRPLENKTAGD